MSKKQPGSPLRYDAATWNGMVDAAEDYKRRRALGGGGASEPKALPTDIIRIKNASGAARSRGQILKIGANLLGSSPTTALLETNHNALWFSGSQPTTRRDAVCVLLQTIASNAIGLAQVSGVCIAKCDIDSTSHTHVRPKPSSSDYDFQSCDTGPGRILWQPSGTGLKTVVIHMATRQPQIWRFTLNEAMGASVANEAEADLLEMDGTDTTEDVDVKDPLGIFADLASGAAGFCVEQGGIYYVIQAECP